MALLSTVVAGDIAQIPEFSWFVVVRIRFCCTLMLVLLILFPFSAIFIGMIGFLALGTEKA